MRCGKKTTAVLALLVAFACPLAVAQGTQSPDSQDIPVLRRRPPANETGQQPGSSQPAPSAPQSSAPPQTPGRQQGAAPSQGPAPPQTPASPQTAPQPSTAHDDHHAEVMRYGAEVMGFDQQTTSHHFLLTRSGGVLRVTANDPHDAEGAGQISIHLRDIAGQFARGDFSAPQHTHGQTPPGVPVMQQLRRKIVYTAHAIAGGAELIISSEDPRAIDAIHRFLQFQIQEHQTGDSTAVR